MVALLLALGVLAVALVLIVYTGGGIADTRKALGMALAPWLALPLADWVTSGQVDVSAVGTAVVSTVTALVTFYVPNTARGEVVR